MSKHAYGASYSERPFTYPDPRDNYYGDNGHGYDARFGDAEGIVNNTPSHDVANDPQLPFNACMFAYGRGFTFNRCTFTQDHIAVPNAALRDTPDQRRPAASNHVNDDPEDKKKDPGNNIDWTPIVVGAALLVLAGGCIALSTTRKLAWRMWTGL